METRPVPFSQVAITGLLFICTGQKLHKYLICAMGMSIGTFGGLVLCDQMDITEMKPKWSVSLALGKDIYIFFLRCRVQYFCDPLRMFPPLPLEASTNGRTSERTNERKRASMRSLALGLALWIAVMFVETIMFNALGMFVGGTAAMVTFSVIVEYVPPMPGYYFFIVIGVGVVLGFFLSGYVKDLALTIVYSIQGGFLLGSCVSYTFWKHRLSHGDLWLENLTASAAGLDLTSWPILVSLSSMVVFAAAGFFIQNNLIPSGSKADAAASPDEKKPLLKDEEKGVVPESMESKE